MDFKRFFNTDTGRAIMSFLLGLGLATIFRKVCNDRNCLVFKGPVLDQVNEKIVKYGDDCYQYKLTSTRCDPTKKTLHLETKE